MRWWTSCISVCEQTHMRVHAHTRTNPHQYAIIVPWPFTLTVYWLWPEGPIKRHQLYRPNGNVSWPRKNTHTQPPTPTHAHGDTNNNNYCLRSFVEICSSMQKTDPQINLLLTSKSMCFSMCIQMRVRSSPSTNTAATPAPASLIFTLRVFFCLFVCLFRFVFASHLTVKDTACKMTFVIYLFKDPTLYPLFFTPAEQDRTVNYQKNTLQICRKQPI